MSDEIEIEEHDVLDNPTIKRIFPDISVIKKELNEYYDEALSALPQINLDKKNQETTSSELEDQSHVAIPNKHEMASSSDGPKTKGTKRPGDHLHQNIIILGSKPNTKSRRNSNNVAKKEPKLILEDMSYWLNNSTRFCKNCLILFPKSNLLNMHNRHVHSKRTNVMTSKLGCKIGILYKCNICKKRFSNSGNLSRHIRNLHGDVYKSFLTEDPGNNSSNDSSKSEKTSGFSCFHCQELFPSQSCMIEHLYNVLKPGNISKSDKSISPTSTKDLTQEDKPNNSSIENKSANNFNELIFGYKDDCNNQSEPNTGKSIANDLTIEGLSVQGREELRRPKRTSNSTPETTKIREPSKQFNNKNKLDKHIKSPKNTKKKSIKKKKNREMFYRCLICSKFSMSFRIHARHIRNEHKMKDVHKVKKEAFDPQCKLCSSKLSGVFTYNMHLYKNHKNIYKAVKNHHEQIDDDGVHKKSGTCKKKNKFALKNVLFKCMECDLFFLSSNAAVNHSKHQRRKNTQECEVCHRILELKDMALHKKQHLFSQSLTIYIINESTLKRILYKCSNCTVHYSEVNFTLHYVKCDSETPDSLYCKVCDILVNRDDMECHSLKHEDEKIQRNDFFIIESEMIDHRFLTKDDDEFNIKKIEESYLKLYSVSNLIMHFCHNCKCFVNPVSFKNNVHVEGRCGHMVRTVCQECGLLLTAKSHTTHKEYHKTHKFCLFDYQFFDLTTKKRISPPIPEYPKCNNCGVHFLRNRAVAEHLCQDQDYIICSICSMKLTEHAYKLHMGFHNYSVQNKKTPLNENPSFCNQGGNASNDQKNLTGTDASCIRDFIILYTCKGCHLTVNTYDKVVQHCQDHYNSEEIILNMQKCKTCSFMFEMTEYDSHYMSHPRGKYTKNKIKTIDFDPIYFRFDNVFWTKHVFAYVSDDQIEKILNVSIYRHECRLQMQEIQSGSSDLILYKCAKCQLIIEPHSLYTHAEKSRNLSCVKLRTTQCAFCSLCFDSQSYRSKHEAEHDSFDMKSYKIILFNKEEHDKLNKILYDASNRYILYQCRNCEKIVDKFLRGTHKCDQENSKLCGTCGLLLHTQDFDSHFIRHEELQTFKTENINVVMFGKCSLGEKERRSTFRGTIYDYTIYKCTKCNLCLSKKSCKSAHVCVFDNSKCKCSKCGLYFSDVEMIRHSKLHESNVGFDDYTMNIISFEVPSTNLDIEDKLVSNSNILKTVLEANETNVDTLEGASAHLEKLEKIYKCDCGLHFLEEGNAQKHSKHCSVKMKISRQRCIKCDLLFTPGELFNHLLKHHCDKKQQFTFDIVNVTMKKS